MGEVIVGYYQPPHFRELHAVSKPFLRPLLQIRGYGVRDRVGMIVQARRDIEIFEELTVHYDSTYWEGKENILCQCGAVNC